MNNEIDLDNLLAVAPLDQLIGTETCSYCYTLTECLSLPNDGNTGRCACRHCVMRAFDDVLGGPNRIDEDSDLNGATATVLEQLSNQLLALRRNNAMPLWDQQQLERVISLVLQDHAETVSELEAKAVESLELAQEWMRRYDRVNKELAQSNPSRIRRHEITSERWEELQGALDRPEGPTEAEAEEVLQHYGTSGKEVVNQFIERLLSENLQLKGKLAQAKDVGSEQEELLEFAADVGRNQQQRVNELERRIGLLLRYVDHQRGCTSYTNGPCTCGFESAMKDPAMNDATRDTVRIYRGEKARNVSPECWREEHGNCECSSLICRCECHRAEIDYFGAGSSV